MNLKEKLLYSSFEFKDDVLYKVIEDFHFFYLKLSNKKEVVAICLNKALLHKNDLKVINKKFKGIARIYSDNLLLRNDVLYIDLISYDNIISDLENIGKYLHYINYYERKNCVMCCCSASYNTVDNKLIPIEEKCIEKYHNDKKLLKEKDKNIKKALLMALLGAFIGILPSLIIAMLVESYTIVSSILVFICPFLSMILYYKNDVNRTNKSDLLCVLISLLFVILYHVSLILICINAHNITSFKMYFEVLKYYVYESYIETIMMFIIGMFSAMFLIKKKTLIRFSKV